MNVGGGEAADQMVRMMLSGTEVIVRLSGSALKNLLALTMALANNRKVLSGKVNMGKMLRETRDLRRFPMTPQQYKQFKRLAKKHKLLFSVIKDKDDKGKLMDVILPVTELERANAIFERILYTLPPEPERKPAKPLQQGYKAIQERQAPEREASEKMQIRQESEQEKAVVRPQKDRPAPEKPQREGSQLSAGQGRPKAPVPQRQENTQKNGSRSERDSPAIKASSSTPKESVASMGTSERSSVAARLKMYQVQLKKPSAPAKVKSRVRPKQR